MKKIIFFSKMRFFTIAFFIGSVYSATSIPIGNVFGSENFIKPMTEREAFNEVQVPDISKGTVFGSNNRILPNRNRESNMEHEFSSTVITDQKIFIRRWTIIREQL